MITSEGVELPEGNTTDVQDGYKYPRILQTDHNHEKVPQRSATAKYLQRVRQVLKSQLNGENKIQTIHAYQ